MEQSILHIKAPHDVHIGAKVMAAKQGISMNQLVVDLLIAAMEYDGPQRETVQAGIRMARNANPEQKKILDKAAEVTTDLIKPAPPGPKKISKPDIIKNSREARQKVHELITKNPPETRNAVLCKNGHPLDKYGERCMQKGCKYA